MITEGLLQFLIFIFQAAAFIYAVIIHEYMHGWVADRLGDPTARLSGRLTMNPLPHIDWYGSVVLPLLLIVLNTGFVFGWAKPVPINPYNLRDHKYGSAKVAAAGPLGNLIMALMFGLSLRFILSNPQFQLGGPMVVVLLGYIVLINLLLMVFNLIPIPPLDGSKIIMPFLPLRWQLKILELERVGLILVLIFVMLFFQWLAPIIFILFKIIVGVPFDSF
ncbi:site-2 protease family protein [Candidatus Parcubacteria bacterium]|nr:MAG: site-2 protease family protein [Candidatus Parcubacteria bacterium]